MHRRSTTARAAFTLVEMLVVVAIIGVLASLVAGAVMQVIGTQKVNNTELTVRKVAGELEKHWKLVADEATNEAIPSNILNGDNSMWGLLAMADPTGFLDPTRADPARNLRARVIWVKLRLRQEFPMSFAEIVNDTGAINPIMDLFFRTYPPPFNQKPFIVLPPKQQYVQALVQAFQPDPMLNQLSYYDTQRDPEFLDQRSSCLYLALSQSRRGIKSQLDSILSSAELATKHFKRTPPGGPDGLKQIVDAWGNGLVLYRWPTLNQEVERSSPAGASLTVRVRDPQDSTGLLTNVSWCQSPNLGPGRMAFEQLCHLASSPPFPSRAEYPTIRQMQPPPAPRSFYTQPVVASAGRNGRLGLWNATIGSKSPDVRIDLVLPDPMALPDNSEPPTLPLYIQDYYQSTPAALNATFDNIYSYRQRQGARGD